MGSPVDVPQASEDDYGAFRRILAALRGRYEIGGWHLARFKNFERFRLRCLIRWHFPTNAA